MAQFEAIGLNWGLSLVRHQVGNNNSMRPETLFPLFGPATALPGIGPRLAPLVERVAGPRIVNLLWHLPNGIIDRNPRAQITDAPDGAISTLTVRVDQHLPAPTRRLPYKVRCSDDSGELVLVFFHARADYLKKTLPEGQTRIVSGRIEDYQDERQMTHPDHIVSLENAEQIPAIEPVYPLTAGLTAKPLYRAVRAALDRVPDLPEWQETNWLAKNKWSPWRESLIAAHTPQSEDDLNPRTSAHSRLAYDELLANQLALALIRQRLKQINGRPIVGDGHLRAKVIEALPYTLTASQSQSLGEILGDMSTPTRMLRLLQGDVGSGKTIVALLAMLDAVEYGAQAALMAPTEILARQHYASITPLCEAVGVSVALLTGRDKSAEREERLAEIRNGKVQIALGTHALFQEGVEFNDLALAVVDEQHRFGVHQRMQLSAKGNQGVDVLVMTATPIPRTLTLTAYGDLDISRLTEKPPGRQPIDTRIIPESRLDEVIQAVGRAINEDARIYWVCPLIEESDAVDAAAAEARHQMLTKHFGARVGLIHGRLRPNEKDSVMADFQEGRISILVATTVIEVGVDVPAANIMVIEQAERFGLAQLHQLRGRIGRGTETGVCLLLYNTPLTETARARLNILRETDDGFRIAEEDLRLRGAGELLGTRQSGLPAFRLADLACHGELLQAASDDCRLILERDPALTSTRGEALRILLYLFEQDESVHLLEAG